MRWYLLKTWSGKEEDLVKEILRTVPSHLYEECFVIYQERIWRKQQRSIIHVEPMWPGCVFLTCKESHTPQKADGLFCSLEKIISAAGLILDGGYSFFPMMKEDGDFLSRISGKEHLVRLSYVLKNEEGQIRRISGPLKGCCGQIERYQFKKRYAMVRHRLWGEEQAIVLGIMLKEDRGRLLLYENSEILGSDSDI